MPKRSHWPQVPVVVLLMVLELAVNGARFPAYGNGTTLVEGTDYVPGMVILRFKPEYMPTRSQVALEQARLGLADVDSKIASHRGLVLRKYLPTFNKETSDAGRYLEKTFVLYYEDDADPQLLVEELSTLPYFEEVKVNRILRKIYGGGTSRFEPCDQWFDDQWNLDNDQDDRVDIDAPEAWEIERGDPSIIIAIIDSGVMFDVSGIGGGIQGSSPYRLHSDLEYFFNDPEDNSPKGVVGVGDLDGQDAGDPDLGARPDNVIGYSFGFEGNLPSWVTDPIDQRFWLSMPHNWAAGSASVLFYRTHGIRVASIAASLASTPPICPNNIAGVANQCRVYVLRDGGAETNEVAETDAIIMAADFADVII